MKFIKDLLVYWGVITVAILIRPLYYFFKILLDSERYVNSKLKDDNHFKPTK